MQGKYNPNTDRGTYPSKLSGEPEIVVSWESGGARGSMIHHDRVEARRLEVPEVEIPELIVGADVEWMEKYDNSPEIFFHLDTDHIQDHIWQKFGGVYVGEHPSGFVDIHYHNGALDENGVSTRQEGYGGRSFVLNMKDNNPYPQVTLRGPWHGGPAGAHRAGYPHRLQECKVRFKKGQYPNMGFFGFYLKEEVYLCAAKKFLPDCEMWEVFSTAYMDGGRHWWEPARKKWERPKTVLKQEWRNTHKEPDQWKNDPFKLDLA